MFRKPKRKAAKETLRRKKTEEDDEDNDKKISAASFAPTIKDSDDEDEESTTSDLIREARKRVKKGPSSGASTTTTTTAANEQVMHSYATSSERGLSHADRATSTAQHLPEKLMGSAGPAAAAATAAAKKDDTEKKESSIDDGIYRGDTQKRNAFLAGPIKAAANVRVTARFDYQPDICKDYKDTGFCGFGDTCIYLHDRGDTLAGWQIDQQWEQEQQRKKQEQEAEMQKFLDHSSKSGSGGSSGDGVTIEGPGEDDGLPFACFICREHFKDPVVTTCQHYFCQDCIMDHVRNNNNNDSSSNSSSACPICNKDTHGVFHQPTKLIAKKRKALGGGRAAKAEDSWEKFFALYSSSSKTE